MAIINSNLFNIVVLPVVGGVSYLQQKADSLVTGSATTTQLDLTGTGFDAGWLSGYHFDYSQRMVHDATRGVIWWYGKTQSSTTSNVAALVRYTISTNTWERLHLTDGTGGWPLGGQLGHGYDSFDVNHADGSFNFHPHQRAQICKFQSVDSSYNGVYDGGGSYTNFNLKWPALGVNRFMSSAPATPLNLVYHPNLFGSGQPGWCVTHIGASTKKVYFYKQSTDTWTSSATLSGASTLASANHGVGVYSSVTDKVYISTGNNNNQFYIISGGATPTVTRGGDFIAGSIPAPHSNIGISNRMVLGPSGTPVIFERNVADPNTSRIWKYDITTNVWANFIDPPYNGVAHPFNILGSGSTPKWVVTWLPAPYNAYLMMTPGNASNVYALPKLYLWKPSPGL